MEHSFSSNTLKSINTLIKCPVQDFTATIVTRHKDDDDAQEYLNINEPNQFCLKAF